MAYEPKTTKTNASVPDFIATVPREEMRRDCAVLVKLMKKVTGEPAAMWGPNIVGFGTYTLAYAGGGTSEWPRLAFSPRKPELVLYVLREFPGCPPLMKKLGKHRTGKICLYLKSLADVDLGVLEELLVGSLAEMGRRYPAQAKPGGKTAKAQPKVAGRKATAKKAAKKATTKTRRKV